MNRNGWIIESTFPAPGWFARINASEGGGEIFDSPLACWAVIESSEGQEVVGLMATDEVTFADEYKGFTCYIHESEIREGAVM